MQNISVLVIGAGGFTGGFIVEECLRRGWQVYAGVRESTSRAFLTDPALRFLIFDFDDADSIASTLRSAEIHFTYIIYNLGATKALTFREFNAVNFDILDRVVRVLKQTDLMPDKFLYISSLSVMGKGDERGYTPFRLTDIPAPDTRYGASKLKAEMLLQSSDIPYIIFRCTGIYGPHERDYFLMFKSIEAGVDFSVGMRRQLLTFIYVEDLARGIADALERAPVKHTYLISEPTAYTQKQFRALAARSLGKRFVLPVKAPVWLLGIVCRAGGIIGNLKHRPLTLNPDKYKILKQRNWNVDISEAVKDFGFSPRVSLKDGIEKSIAWYRRAGWLKQR